MAAGLGFKTFTTGEVLTAANVNGYLMQGILVFASAAARDAAITSPQEGQACYLKDTDAVQTYSGSAWTAVGGAGGGMTLISTTTLSGASTVLSSIPATYNNLVLIVKKPVLSVDGNGLRMRINADTATRYRSQEFGALNITAAAPNLGYLPIIDDNDDTSSDGLIQIQFFDYTNATTFKLGQTFGITNYSVTSTSFNMSARMHAYNQTAAITSLTFIPESGTLTSGTVLLYGVK